MRERLWERFCTSLGEYALNFSNFFKKKMLLLTKKVLKLQQAAKVCYVSGKKDKTHRKVRDHFNYTGE